MKHKTIYRPRHPRASSSGDVYLHVYVAERALGRLLPDGVEVHHVDGDPTNNRNANLVICQDKAFHKLLHARSRVVRAGGNPNTQKVCGQCDSVKDLGEFNVMRANKSSGRQSACRECSKALDAVKRASHAGCC